MLRYTFWYDLMVFWRRLCVWFDCFCKSIGRINTILPFSAVMFLCLQFPVFITYLTGYWSNVSLTWCLLCSKWKNKKDCYQNYEESYWDKNNDFRIIYFVKIYYSYYIPLPIQGLSVRGLTRYIFMIFQKRQTLKE